MFAKHLWTATYTPTKRCTSSGAANLKLTRFLELHQLLPHRSLIPLPHTQYLQLTVKPELRASHLKYLFLPRRYRVSLLHRFKASFRFKIQTT